ncbi:MAG TPA: endonuclease/exonuclease/phosphatase family protein [Candidatus Saccharimonadia bacterium]|nr:endonuclease/exonuclease/phosphatase family protein [Candidatus Saccharimonadia bacterium]
MKLVSWNIQGGKNLDGVASVLEQLSPDIVTLQEVKEQDGHNSAELLARRLGYAYRFHPAFTTERHTPSYTLGNGVLSRLEVISSEVISLSALEEYEGSSATEPRNASLARVNLPNGELLHVVSSHLAYSKDFERSKPRDRQIANLLKAISNTAPVILGLDLNSEPGTSVLQTLTRHFINSDSSSRYSWTNSKVSPPQLHRIDYILRSSDVKQRGFQIIDTDASDHRPLVLDFEL